MSKKPKIEETKPAAAAAEAVFPLFFKNPRPLDVNRHKQATITPDKGYAFAAETNSIPMNAIEFIEASRHYPIVFTGGDTSTPAVVVGLEKQNYFVDAKDGSWKSGRYIPAYVRQYPFVFMEVPEQEKFFLCVDEAAPHFNAGASKAKDTSALYTAAGEASPLTQHVLDFCTAFYNHFRITANFCADLRAHNLLIPYKSDAKLASGRQISLGGFLMIDEKAFNSLSEKVFLEFRAKGWLPFIYFALASGTNWKGLVDIASAVEPAAAA